MRKNLSKLCIDAQYDRLRRVLIMSQPPEWLDETDMVNFEVKHSSLLEPLNDEQKKAVVKTFCCRDYQMVIGVPGSGKLWTQVHMLRVVKALGHKVCLFGVNQNVLDKLLITLLDFEEKTNVPAD